MTSHHFKFSLNCYFRKTRNSSVHVASSTETATASTCRKESDDHASLKRLESQVIFSAIPYVSGEVEVNSNKENSANTMPGK